MKKQSFALLAATTAFLTGTTAAHAAYIDMVLNISGSHHQLSTGEKPYIWHNPLEVSLPAGTYTLTPVKETYPGAQYTAYSYFSYGGSWSSIYFMAPDPQHITRYGEWTLFDTPEQAFAHAAGGTFTLAQAGKMYFGVNDSYYYDNRGGVSVRLTQAPAVPLPAALPLLGTGLIGLVGYGRMRKKKA